VVQSRVSDLPSLTPAPCPEVLDCGRVPLRDPHPQPLPTRGRGARRGRGDGGSKLPTTLLLQIRLDQLREPRARDRDTLLRNALGLLLVCRRRLEGPEALADRLAVDGGLRELEALVDPFRRIEDGDLVVGRVVEILGRLDRRLEAAAGAERVVPEPVQFVPA